MAHATAASYANEGFFAHLFTARGRTNRAKFWLAMLVYLLVYGVAGGVFYLLYVQGMTMTGIAIAGVVYLVSIVSSIFVSIRRLHDRDKSGHWLWLFYLVPGILSGIGSAMMELNPQATLVAIVPSVVSIGIYIWAIVELGFLRGTQGANRFGPDPLQA
jgi:uncharacterized membrane protein YhaH (DUF805 family)